MALLVVVLSWMQVAGHRRSVSNWGFKRRIKVIESGFSVLCRLLVFRLSHQYLLLPLTRYDLSVRTPTVFLFGVSLHIRPGESANLPTQSEVFCSSRSNWPMTTFLKRMISKVWKGVATFVSRASLVSFGLIFQERARGWQSAQEEETGLRFLVLPLQLLPPMGCKDGLWVVVISFEALVVHALLCWLAIA